MALGRKILPASLLERRVVGRFQEDRFHAIGHSERAAALFFAGSLRRNPSRVGAEGVEGSLGRVDAGVGKHVDHRFISTRLILLQLPIPQVGHPVLGEKREGMVPETLLEQREFALRGGVGP